MNREVHVRLCKRGRGRLPRATYLIEVGMGVDAGAAAGYTICLNNFGEFSLPNAMARHESSSYTIQQ